MNNSKEINKYFNNIISDINIILNNKFYKNKFNLEDVKIKIISWQKNYNKNNTLKSIDVKELEYLDLEITDFFANYIENESVTENYAETLYFDFSQLEHIWKDEMLEKK